MNRTVALPGLCSLIAFGAFYVGRLGSSGYGASTAATPFDTNAFDVAPAESAETIVIKSVGAVPIQPQRIVRDESQPSSEEAAALLRKLAEQYRIRYASFETAPHRMMSRASFGWSERPPIQVDVALSPRSPQQQSRLASATISIRQRQLTVVLPCVVDVATQEIFVFRSNRWLTAQEWLDTAAMNDYGFVRQPKKPG